ncbi:MAG: hypothetical protein EOR99_11765 [Mesorhizobium sp.]|nr:MAG: hypothetical protein EOR99_11765 [Mesorhizobium sp.]
MASSAAEFASICFSTEGLPEPDRFEFWREVLGRAITKFEIDPVPDSSPDASITLRALPGVDIASGAAAGMQYRRTPALIDSDDIVLFVALSGAQTVDQIGRECTISAGEAAVFACAEPGLAIPRERQRRIAFRTPHDVLAPMVGNVEDAICKPIPSTVDSLRLLVSYAATLEDVDQPLTPRLRTLRQPISKTSSRWRSARPGMPRRSPKVAACVQHGSRLSRPISSAISAATTSPSAPWRCAMASRHAAFKSCSRPRGGRFPPSCSISVSRAPVGSSVIHVTPTGRSARSHSKPASGISPTFIAPSGGSTARHPPISARGRSAFNSQ